MAAEPQLTAAPQAAAEPQPATKPQPSARPPAGADRRGRTVRRRTRLVRGPLTIGDPAPAIEPELSDAEPYRPDSIADGGTAFGLTVRAASVRGLSKRYLGGPRQDDLCLRRHGATETLIAAVADGVSAAPRSALGAALAVRHATAAVAQQLDRGDPDSVDFGQVFEHAAWALVEEHRRASGDGGAGPEPAGESLATTLVVAVISSGRARAAAVGDSPALLLRGAMFEPIVAEPERSDGFAGGSVPALPRSVDDLCQGDRELVSGDVLLLCTDGLALPLADGSGEVGRMLARELATVPDTIDFARLLDFSRSTYDDDRSLVAVWPP